MAFESASYGLIFPCLHLDRFLKVLILLVPNIFESAKLTYDEKKGKKPSKKTVLVFTMNAFLCCTSKSTNF